MKYRNLFVETALEEGQLRTRGGGTRQVCTVARACQILQRSRRQIYRYLESGDLVPAGKVLGQWLVERDSVQRLSKNPMTAQPMSSRLQHLFPEHDLARLNVGRDADFVLSRVLEAGSLQDAKWAFQRYGAHRIAHFLQAEGSRQLSPRSLRLWSLYLEVRPQPIPPWRGTSPWHDR